ncbi:ATP-binding protein [Pseudomonas soli]|uniref:ATP-binding protein n=1 Tax=Pseudomonas soli TaxID=1306993 RepID=UPI001E625515|nr:ATP-binding protein [Pseudomonas soli]WJO23186.1 ATP-binding protein [Pseudomonas soli]
MWGMNMSLSDDAIHFPKSLSESDPEALFRFCASLNAGTDNVTLDASELCFIDPLGLAVLRATLECQPVGRTFHVRFMPKDMIKYFVRMDFFQGLSVEGVDVESGRNPEGEPDSCVELQRVVDGQSEAIASRLVQAMIGQTAENADPLMEACRRPIEYSLKELLENALSHARKEGNFGSSVWVACQHFRSNGVVRLAIVDNGCGFLATLKRHPELAEQTDCAAIQAALKERVSCNRGPLVGYETDSQNQGVGLTTTAKIAGAAGGFLVVASGDAWLRTDFGHDQSSSLIECPWKGVAISFHCNRDQLPQVDIPSLLPAVEDDVGDEINFD